MTAKRALVVDDSKSARAFLAKLLEEQSLEVDAAETAEQAIDYLAHHRPDVIFMDHLMPGMDGFQAVQAIKSNPRTAMIPILMYTSQEGELYLGQARALGAVGVLPKSVAPTDVRTVLQQLHLIEQPETTVAAQPELLDAAEAVAATVEVESTARLITESVATEQLRDEMAALRHHVAEQLEHFSQRLSGELRNAVRDAQPMVADPLPPQEPERPGAAPWLLALAAGLAAVVLGTLWYQASQREQAVRNELADARATVAEMSARLTSAAAPAVAASDAVAPAVGGVAQVVVKVPFGEAPLAGTRIEKLRDFVTRLMAQNARGTVEVRRYAGRFCLTGGNEGFSLAEASTSYIKCDLVADATDPQLRIGAPESIAFANMLTELRRQAGDAIHIDVQEGRNDNVVTAYPEIGGTPPRVPNAGEWNAAAEANNRVEIRWHPAT
jgi:CheY-like chemotaxis protein